MRFFLKYWAPVLTWLGVIFVASGDLMSAEHTSRFIGPFLRWLNPDISVDTIAQFQFCVRKAAHLTEYAILALLLCRAVSRGTNLMGARSTLLGIWIACVLVAAGDEFHQSYVASRGASSWDVMIDGVGGIVGILIYSGWARRKRSKLLPGNRNSQIKNRQ